MTADTLAATTHRDEEGASVIATLVIAFSADPIMRWIFPDTDRYLRCFPQLANLMAAPAFTAGSVDSIGDDAGAAVWVPPGQEVDEERLGGLVQDSVDVHRHVTAFAFLEQTEHHHPTAPHWYLPMIGVEARHQGRGLGSILLQQGLARCDAHGLPAYLEATSVHNRALYERHGFVVTGEIQAGDSPPLWPMQRPAQ